MIKKIIYILMLGTGALSIAGAGPTPTPTMTMTAIPTATAMPTATATATATVTPTATATTVTGAGYGQDNIEVTQPISSCPVSGTGGTPGMINLTVTNNGGTSSAMNNCDRMSTVVSSSGGAHMVVYGGATPGAGALTGSDYDPTMTYGGTQAFGIDMPGQMLLLAPFRTDTNYVIRSVANACPTPGYFNWIYVEKPGGAMADPLFGVVYNTNAAAYITDEWNLLYTQVLANAMIDMGSGSCNSGYQYTSNSNIEETGTGIWSAGGMGAYWSLSSRNGTLSVPRATYVPANYAGRRYAGMMTEKGGFKALNGLFWFTNAVSGDGLTFTIDAIDPRNGSNAGWTDTFTLNGPNVPAQGFMQATSGRLGPNWICIHHTYGSDRFIGCLGPNMATLLMRSSL